MKYKIAAAAVLACMFFNTCAFAEALRRDPLLLEAANRPSAQENDILFDDFSGYVPGTVPSSVRSNGASGTLFLKSDEVSEGFKKNCLEFTDTVDSGGPQALIGVPETSGIVSIETRYKYTSTGAPWSVFRLTLHGYENGTLRDFAWMSVQSGNGCHYYNNGGKDQTQLTTEAAKDGGWYHVKMYVDFNASVIHTAFTDESTGKTTYAIEKGFYNEFAAKALAQVNITCTVGTGKWTVDYVRVSQEKELPAFADGNADTPKGVEAAKVSGPVNHAVPDRINIRLDEKYKYLSAEPYVSDNGNIMVTLKNMADIFGLRYFRKGTEFTLKKGESSYIFNAGEDYFKADGKSVDLGESSDQKGYQLYVPIKPAAEYLGYKADYDEQNRCVNIITPSENGGEEIEN